MEWRVSSVKRVEGYEELEQTGVKGERTRSNTGTVRYTNKD